MPFVPFKTAKTDGKTHPLLLIPGITGNYKELQGLVDNIQTINPDQTIYVWHDARYTGSSESKSIETIALEIKNVIDRNWKESPYYLSGFSFGGPIAVKVAQLLTQEDREVFVSVIDSPAPEYTKRYLDSGKSDVTKDIIKIVRYAGLQSHLKLPEIDEKSIESWKEMPIKEQYETIIHHYKKLSLTNSRFETTIEIVKNNLLQLKNVDLDTYFSLLNEPGVETTLKNLQIITTVDTCDKYKCPDRAGWDLFALKVSLHSIKDGDHLSIVSMGQMELAKKMHAFFFEEKPVELVKSKPMSIGRKKKMEILLTKDAPSSPSSLSSCSPDSSPSHSPVEVAPCFSREPHEEKEPLPSVSGFWGKNSRQDIRHIDLMGKFERSFGF